MLSRTSLYLARIQTRTRLAQSLSLTTTTLSPICRPHPPSPLPSFSPRFASGMAAPTDTAATSATTPTTTATSAALTPDSLTSTLKSKLPSITHLEIHDMSGGCGQAFTAVIVSSEFQGKTALARHRLVNAALREEIAAIHAWTPRCLTPDQWEKEKAQ